MIELSLGRHFAIEVDGHGEQDFVVRVDAVLLLVEVGQQIDALQPTMRYLVGVEAVFLEDAVVRSSLQLLDGGGLELLEGILALIRAREVELFLVRSLVEEEHHP